MSETKGQKSFLINTMSMNWSKLYLVTHGILWTWVDPDGGTPHYVFILPIVAFIALVCNILIITVFVKQKMMSTTNIIMTGIAISDTLTVMSPTPLLIYIYGSGHAHIIMGSKHSYQNRRPKLQQDRRPLWFCSSYLIKSFNGIVQIFFTRLKYSWNV
jgi:ABC-type Fe3+-siderophore transport system permease subunit